VAEELEFVAEELGFLAEELGFVVEETFANFTFSLCKQDTLCVAKAVFLCAKKLQLLH